jgi:hypothetical protein
MHVYRLIAFVRIEVETASLGRKGWSASADLIIKRHPRRMPTLSARM